MPEDSSVSQTPLLKALADSGPSEPQEPLAPEVELFCLTVAGEPYGVEPGLVHEVVRAPAVTPLPGAPGFLAGVTVHRGDVLATVDLARLLGRGETRLGERGRMVVARVNGYRVALLADQVLGLKRFAASAMAAAPLGVPAAELIRSVIVADPCVNVLDLPRALATAREQAIARG